MAIEKLTSEELELFTDKVNKIYDTSLLTSLIRVVWSKQSKTGINYACKPYLEALIYDSYGYDSKKSIILYALSNMGSFKGDKAKILKARLKILSNQLES